MEFTVRDSIRELLNAELKLTEITEILDIPSFAFADVEFLREYERCTRPIAYVLDKLQGDDVYMSDILPWILAVEHNLQDVGVVENDTKALRYR
jgi:hypothetical protein